MFTGIVERTVEVAKFEKRTDGANLALEFGDLLGELSLGQSIAINGTCLTVARMSDRCAEFDLAGETLRCTAMERLALGSVVNIERCLRLGDRLDGHIVQGHVDGVGEIQSFAPRGDDFWLRIQAEDALLRQMIHKGSITVDGISLTIAELDADGFGCTIIPHTRAVTNLVQKKPGDPVNLEVDMVGKWIRRMMQGTAD